MAEGLQVWSDSGFIQIDSNYMNLGLLASVVLYTQTAASQGIEYANYSVTWVKYTTQNKNSLLAIRCGWPAAAIRTIDNGSNYTYWIAVNAGLNSQIFIYEFGEMSRLPTNSGVGFEVYMPSGQLAFSSNYRYMRVAGWVDGSKAENQAPISRTYDPGRQYACVLSTGSGYVDSWFDGNAHWQNIRWLLMANAIAGGIYFNEYSIYDNVNSTQLYGKAGYSYSALIIDVTGY